MFGFMKSGLDLIKDTALEHVPGLAPATSTPEQDSVGNAGILDSLFGGLGDAAGDFFTDGVLGNAGSVTSRDDWEPVSVPFHDGAGPQSVGGGQAEAKAPSNERASSGTSHHGGWLDDLFGYVPRAKAGGLGQSAMKAGWAAEEVEPDAQRIANDPMVRAHAAKDEFYR